MAAKKTYTIGLSKIEVGAIAEDGGMGETLDVLGYTYQDTCTMTQEDPETTDHYAEEVDDPVISISQGGKTNSNFSIMNPSAELKAALSGGIYVQGERPDNSGKEDVVINNLFLNHEVPQTGTSNVNIHVPDKKERIGRTEQFKAHRERIRELTAIVLSVLKSANITGLTIRVSTETIIKEPGINEHYNNLRVEWNIQRTN